MAIASQVLPACGSRAENWNVKSKAAWDFVNASLSTPRSNNSSRGLVVMRDFSEFTYFGSSIEDIPCHFHTCISGIFKHYWRYELSLVSHISQDLVEPYRRCCEKHRLENEQGHWPPFSITALSPHVHIPEFFLIYQRIV